MTTGTTHEAQINNRHEARHTILLTNAPRGRAGVRSSCSRFMHYYTFVALALGSCVIIAALALASCIYHPTAQLLRSLCQHHPALVPRIIMHCLLLSLHALSCIAIGCGRNVRARAGCNNLPVKAAAALEARYHQTARDQEMAQWYVPRRKGRQTRCSH